MLGLYGVYIHLYAMLKGGVNWLSFLAGCMLTCMEGGVCRGVCATFHCPLKKAGGDVLRSTWR